MLRLDTSCPFLLKRTARTKIVYTAPATRYTIHNPDGATWPVPVRQGRVPRRLKNIRSDHGVEIHHSNKRHRNPLITPGVAADGPATGYQRWRRRSGGGHWHTLLSTLPSSRLLAPSELLPSSPAQKTAWWNPARSKQTKQYEPLATHRARTTKETVYVVQE